MDKDKHAWAQEQEQVSQKVVSAEELIELDVSGVTQGFKVRRSLLTSVPGSALEAMFSGRHTLKKVNNKVFIDRNPNIFGHVLDFLRNN